MGDNLKFIL